MARFSQGYDGSQRAEPASGSKSSIEPCDAPPALLPKKWYAVHTAARHEKAGGATAGTRGKTYLPLVEGNPSLESYRRKRVQVPLFPGGTPSSMLRVHPDGGGVAAVEGVVRVVGTHPSGTPIPEEPRNPNCPSPRLPQHTLCEWHPFLEAGPREWLRGGPLDGVEGTLVALEKEQEALWSRLS